jgi:hypothetical protein
MDRSDSPPSPLHSSSRSQSTTKRSSRSSKEREKSRIGATSRELVKLLVREEKESHDLRSMVHVLSERLSNEVHRADAAETNAREAVLRFKQTNDARLVALQESSRLNEELQLYKLQLDNAQREINRAQGILDALEAQRFEAEESAARARTTARKLKEEKLVQVAHDEGRLQGFKEGISQGRLMGYEQGRAEGYARGRAATARELAGKDVTSSFDFKPHDIIPLSDSTNVSPPPPDYSVPSAESIVVRPPPVESQLASTPAQHMEDDIHPVIIHNIPPSPVHTPVDYPPEGWVPTIDNDQRIRLPPPHELSASPYTPSNTPPPTHYLPPTSELPDEPILMIPPPSRRRATVETISDGDSVTSGEGGGRPRVRRRKSSDSQSTTFSQFDITAPPTAPSGRGILGQRPNVLSAIVEEKSPAMSPVSVPIVHESS